MKHSYSLRFKLITIFMFSILIPILIMMFIMPTYYQNQRSKETELLINNNLVSISENISTYLDELDRLTITPYFDTGVMCAVDLKSSGKYETSTEYSKLLANRALTASLPNYLKNTRKDILSTIIISKNKCIFSSNKKAYTEIVKNYTFTEQDWYKKAIQANGKAVFIGVHKQDYFSNPSKTEVFSIARLIKDTTTQKPLAVIMADANTVVFRNVFSKLKFNVPSKIVLFDDSDNILYSTNYISQNLINEIHENSTIIKDEKDSYMVISKKIPSYNWKISVLLSYTEMRAKIKWMYITSILFALGGLLVTFIIFQILTKNIVNPFQEMVLVMKKVQKGNLNARFSQQRNDEIGVLGTALNTMIIRLKNLIDKEYKLVLEQRNAEYNALQSQIQPHFLYNTLNGFIGLNRLGERKLLEKSILDLTGMLRYTLENNDKTTIKEEFIFLENYCALQKLRFEERITANIYLEDSIENLKIPKLLLQPLVENAIIHGIEPLDKECTISIQAKQINVNNKDYILFTIDDNGAGFITDKEHNKKSVGISNIKKRLKITYTNSYFSIKSKPLSGTNIIIKIPKGEMDK